MSNLDLTNGTKDDKQKLPYHLVPWDAVDEVVDVLRIGAAKYAERNWEKGMDWSRMFSAACRHLKAFWLGEDCDPETGKSHLAHAACCALMLLAYYLRQKGTDDRPSNSTN